MRSRHRYAIMLAKESVLPPALTTGMQDGFG
jgi:hypothetical protein